MKIEEYLWTFNMPTDHPRVSLTNARIPEDSDWGEIGGGLAIGQSFVHQNRIRQAASSLGAAVYASTKALRIHDDANRSANRYRTTRPFHGR